LLLLMVDARTSPLLVARERTSPRPVMKTVRADSVCCVTGARFKRDAGRNNQFNF
jgi:hypothetical protein